MKRYTLNILEKSGCIKTGYEETLFGKTPDEVISDYLNYHREESFPDLEEKDIDCQENSWEGAKMRNVFAIQKKGSFSKNWAGGRKLKKNL